MKEDETIFCIKETNSNSLHVELELNNAFVPFKVNTGAVVTIMSYSSFQQYLARVKLDNTEVALQTYTAELVKVLGEATVQVTFKWNRSKSDGLKMVTTYPLGLEQLRCGSKNKAGLNPYLIS